MIRISNNNPKGGEPKYMTIGLWKTPSAEFLLFKVTFDNFKDAERYKSNELSKFSKHYVIPIEVYKIGTKQAMRAEAKIKLKCLLLM